ncbi:hypothetical protein MMPV_001190 [Pyropia vietnamensis]
MARSSAAFTPPRKRRWPGDGGGSPPAASPRRSTQTGACPLCGVVFPMRMLPVHVDTVCAAEGDGGGRAFGKPRVRPPVAGPPRVAAAGSPGTAALAPPSLPSGGGGGGSLGPAVGSVVPTPASSRAATSVAATARPAGPRKTNLPPLALVVQRVTPAHFHLSWSADGADLCTTWTAAAPSAVAPLSRRASTARGTPAPRPYRDVFTLALSATTSLRLVLTADADVPVSAAPAAGDAAAVAAAGPGDAIGILPGLLARHGRSLGRLPVSLLKSALQKAIRRQLPRAAAVAALGLGARSSAAELLRRLTLIAVEDAAVWPAGYPPLVWLMMAAGRRAVLGARVVDWVLYAAAVIAAGEVRDEHGDGPGCAHGGVNAAGGVDGGVKAAGKADGGGDGGAPASAGPPDTTTPSRVAPSTADGAGLVGALQVRRVYGGSAGDVAMVAAAEATWRARFAAAAAAASAVAPAGGGDVTSPPALTAVATAYARAAASVSARDVSLQALAVPTSVAAPLLPPGSVLLEAVDSHCSSMAEELADTLPKGVVLRLAGFLGDDSAAAVQVVERALWRCRSGINGRRQWVGGDGRALANDRREPGGDPALMVYWEAEVRPTVDEWSRAFLAARGQ